MKYPEATEEFMKNIPPLKVESLISGLESAGILYFRYFPANRTVAVSDFGVQSWGCDPVFDDAPFDLCDVFVAEQDQPQFCAMYASIDAGAPTASSTFRLHDMETWCRVTLTTVERDEDGNPLECIAMLENLSEVKQAEMEMVERNRTLGTLMQVFQIAADATGTVVFIYDTEKQSVLMTNERADHWGVSTEQSGVPYELVESGIVAPESKAEYIRIHEDMINGKSETSAKITMIEPTGERSHQEVVMRALVGEDGTPLGKAAGVFKDVTRYETDSQRKFAIMSAMAEGVACVFFVDLDTDTFMVEQVSNEYTDVSYDSYGSDASEAELYGMSGRYSAMINAHILGFVHPDDRERIAHELKAETVMERLDERNSYYLQYRSQDELGNDHYFEMHVTGVEEQFGKNCAVMSYRIIDEQMMREISQRKALQEAFESANRANSAKSDFLSRMSHDIRTPMNAIMGMTAIAGTHLDDPDRVKDCLSKITVSSKHLLGLIDEVLDMSKIESGELDLNVSEFDLPKLVDNLLAMTEPQIKSMDHKFVVNVHDIEHERVLGDSQRIQQAFMNFMSNAIKYTPSGGVIRLSISEKPTHKKHTGCYEFVFEDNGIGMSEEFLEHLFDPFAREQDFRVGGKQGSGLGLAIANTIVQMMNGDIKVESKIGEGTKVTCTIYLELQDEHDEDLTALLKGLSVLVADDDEITCETSSEILKDLDMNCEWVLSGQEALDLAIKRHEEGNDFFAIILDWKMPQMTGVETARAIRKALGDQIPIVISSAYDWSEIEMEARVAGANSFVSKPMFKSRLAHVLKSFVTEQEEPGEVGELDELESLDLTGKRVLLVEDNFLNAEIATDILQMANLTIEYARDGQEAFEIMDQCEDGYYDMVFMDIQMPKMNGYEATRAIRAVNRDYLKRVPIVAMTADAFAEDVEAARNVGMNEHIAKPIDFDRLAYVLKKWLVDD